MSTVSVRIPARAHQALKYIAARTGQSLQEVLDQAIEEHRRRILLEEANAAFAALKKDPTAWRQELDERAQWDGTLADGQEGD